MKTKITYDESVAPFLFEDELEVDVFETILQEVDMKDEPLPEGVIMRVRGKAHHSNHVTANRTLYTTARYQNAINLLRDEMDAGMVFMGPRHPVITRDSKTNEVINIEAFSPSQSVGLIRRLDILPDGWVTFESDIGDTDNGRNTAAMVRMGAKIPISSRARGSHKIITLTEKHPAAKDNPEWIGQKVKEIQDDFRLKTYDTVEAASSGGSQTTHWREEKENSMEFDISKLTEADWKEIKESKMIADLVAEAVDAKAKELKEEFETEGMKRVEKMVSDTVNSDEFIAKIREGNKEPEEKPALECAHCKAPYVEGALYCSQCGMNPIVEVKPQSKDEKDEANDELKKQVADLLKQNTELAASVDSLKKKNTDEESKVAVDKKVNEALKDVPALVEAQVRVDLATRELTEEGVEDVVATSVKRVEDIFKVTGVNLEKLSEELGKNITDDEKKETKTGPASDAAKKQQGMLSQI